jgi:prophage antirepressor-like protein
VLGYTDTAYAIRTHCKCSEVLKPVESTGLTSSPRGITIIPERDLYRLIMRSKLPAAEKFEEWVVAVVLPTIRKTGRYAMKETHEAPTPTLQQMEGIRNGLPVNTVNESGLYALILRSDKPQAKPLRKWVTSEVLPSIRKTGRYVVGEERPVQNTQAVPNQTHQALEVFVKGLADMCSAFLSALQATQGEDAKPTVKALPAPTAPKDWLTVDDFVSGRSQALHRSLQDSHSSL